MNASVRTANSQLSGAAAGEEIIITSDGRPKAKLVGLGPAQRAYRVRWRLLGARKRAAGTAAETIVRLERDSRD